MGGKSSKAPPPPNYAAIAQAQGEANKETAIASAKLSNPNVITPYGEQTVQYGVGGEFNQAGFDAANANYAQQLEAYQANPQRSIPNPNAGAGGFNPYAPSYGSGRGMPTTRGGGQPATIQTGIPLPNQPLRADFQPEGDPLIPTVTQELNPESQKLYEQEQRIDAELGNIGESQIGNIGSMMGTPFDVEGLPDPAVAGQQGWDNAYQAQIQRNQPFQERAREQTVNRLSNQGIYEGSEAFDNAMLDLGRQENDFNLAAQNNSTAQQQAMFGMDEKSRQNAISQQAYLRQLPLNELNSLLSGTQIQNPQFQAYQGQQIAPPPIFNAAQAQYQASLDQTNASNAAAGGLTSGLFGLGSAGIGAAGLAFSDRRLKSNIIRIANHPLGIGIYEYNIFGTPDVGVMADEVLKVKPSAVAMIPNGYMAVNYGEL